MCLVEGPLLQGRDLGHGPGDALLLENIQKAMRNRTEPAEPKPNRTVLLDNTSDQLRSDQIRSCQIRSDHVIA